VQDDPLGTFQAARADVQAVLDDPEFAGTECDTPAGRMTVEQGRAVPRLDAVHCGDLASVNRYVTVTKCAGGHG
jgi:uncharacterized hydantoinase/oxoprolinase family protein